MIERQMIAGRLATIAYIDDKLEPTTKESATLVKVIFDDGQMLFLKPKGDDDAYSFNAEQ